VAVADSPFNSDTSAIIYLVWTRQIEEKISKISFESLEVGLIGTVATNTTIQINAFNEAVNLHGQPYSIIHQYQHHDLLDLVFKSRIPPLNTHR
jgi:hypothetical protein